MKRTFFRCFFIALILLLAFFPMEGNTKEYKWDSYSYDQEMRITVEYSKFHQQDLVWIQLTYNEKEPWKYARVCFLKEDIPALLNVFDTIETLPFSEYTGSDGTYNVPKCGVFLYAEGSDKPTYSDTDSMGRILKLGTNNIGGVIGIGWHFDFKPISAQNDRIYYKVYLSIIDFINLSNTLKTIE